MVIPIQQISDIVKVKRETARLQDICKMVENPNKVPIYCVEQSAVNSQVFALGAQARRKEDQVEVPPKVKR